MARGVSSLTRDWIPGFGAWSLNHWTTRAVLITHFQQTVKNNNHAIQKHLFLLSQTWYQGQLVLSSQQFWKLRIFYSFILYGEYRGSERQSKQSQHHTAYRGGNTYVCGALCDQALCPRTVQSEEEGIQKLNAIIRTLEREMFPRITFFFFFCRLSSVITMQKASWTWKRAREEADAKSNWSALAIYNDDVSVFLIMWRETHAMLRTWKECRCSNRWGDEACRTRQSWDSRPGLPNSDSKVSKCCLLGPQEWAPWERRPQINL